MKAVLISIQPKWVEKIASGEKTIEVRKTRPKLETPFKCYIYCTKEKKKDDFITISVAFGLIRCPECAIYNRAKEYDCNGKVIGEFVCDRIEEFSEWQFDYASLLRHINLFAGTNGDYKFLDDYLKGQKKGYAWHISDLKIYDKPKELSEFWTIKCTNKRNGCQGCKVKPNCIKTITRPFQSWGYVESLGE